jgi:hypothetical protein
MYETNRLYYLVFGYRSQVNRTFFTAKKFRSRVEPAMPNKIRVVISSAPGNG